MRFIIVLLITSSFIMSSSSAQEAINFQLTPLIGYRFGGDFDDEFNHTDVKLDDKTSYGLLVAWEYDHHRQGELLFSHYESSFFTKQNIHSIAPSDINVSYLHIGGNVKLTEEIIPLFLSGGIGVTHLSPSNNRLNDETEFSGNLGLVTKIAITDSLELYLAGRVYATLFDANSEIFCDKNDCTIFVESEVWIQSELNAGITFSF